MIDKAPNRHSDYIVNIHTVRPRLAEGYIKVYYDNTVNRHCRIGRVFLKD